MDSRQPFMVPNREIQPYINEIVQKDRETFEYQFNIHADGYIRKLLIEFPNLLEEVIRKAVAKGFIDVENATSHFSLYNDQSTVNYTFVEFNGKIMVMLQTQGDVESTLLINGPIELTQFTKFIYEKLLQNYSIKFLSKETN